MVDHFDIEEVDTKINMTAFVDICKMHEACFPEDLMYLPEKGYWWIVRKDGVPCAFAGLVHTNDQRKFSKVYGYMARAGVLRKYRGNGLQRRLIEVRIAKAKQIGMKTLCTSTFDNPISSNNLIACGFRMYMPNKTWGYTGTNYWQLKLNEA